VIVTITNYITLHCGPDFM